ncbi:MAG: purine nucleosidase, partial [Candidatus Promineifilaceae bacterium]
MQRLIIDTDPGVDDAQAILLASAHPNTKIEALLTVGGNVGLEHTTRNALTIVEATGQDIPVYQGCDGPLILEGEDAAWVHGSDGLGDSGIKPLFRKIEKEHAANALVRMVNAEPNEFTLVAIGPLTNIALALKLDPTLPGKIKRFVVMGGAVTAKGNTSNVAAEFNIFADPEAAHVVFEAWSKAGLLIEVIDWEATVRHGVPFEIVQKWRGLNTLRAKFFEAVSSRSLDEVAKRFGRTDLLGADPLALAVAVEPSCVTRAESHYLMVEIGGLYARGQTIVDWQNQMGKAPNASIVLDV